MAALPAGELRPNAPLCLPYLSGERTPHADPAATASFLGMTHATTRDDLSYAVVEGVAFLFADGLQALREAGSEPARLLAIGGGARSDTWLQMLADLLARPVDRPAGAEVGPALGAARLALMSAGHAQDAVVTPPPIARTFEPDAARGAALGERLARFRGAYGPVRALMG
jgi:xylulokinase